MLTEMLQLAEIRVLIGQNRPTEALARLTPLRQAAAQKGRQGRVIELLLLQALAHKAQDNLTSALSRLEEALVLAEPEGYMRLFLDEGEPVAELLRQGRTQGLGGRYLDKLLTAFRAAAKQDPTPPPLIEPLSERELEILQLIEAGLSNQQISERLFLTVGTVKWHVNNIYGKLNVRRRTQAVARARELGVL
jgi:LuxR family maltose regulon positive regulatory protein